MRLNCLIFGALAALLCGCVSYQYRVAQPPGVGLPVADKPVAFHCEPLDYVLAPGDRRLSVRIANPTDDQMFLLGNRSYLVDPRGESHPIPAQVLAPHSHTWLVLPPQPFSYVVSDYPAGGWGWAWPGWGPYYGGFYYGPPPVVTCQVRPPYSWVWTTGLVKMRLSYQRHAQTFDHHFEIVREERP